MWFDCGGVDRFIYVLGATVKDSVASVDPRPVLHRVFMLGDVNVTRPSR